MGSGLAGGDSLVAHRGVVGPGADMSPEFQAGSLNLTVLASAS